MKNTLDNQIGWLLDLPGGSRVKARGSTWIRPHWGFLKNLDRGFFVNVETGEVALSSELASLEEPVRFECWSTPFSS